MVSEPIAIGDTVIVRDAKARLYKQTYGEEALKPRKVTSQDNVQGRRRLYLDGKPDLLWVGDAKLVQRRANK